MSLRRDALEYHRQGRPGKLEVVPTKPLLSQRDLSLAYTPGVAEPCLAIHRRPEDAYLYTSKGNLVAVVTNGTAVLGLGNIGALAGKPVMEGKANLFKKFADLDGVDIELDVTDPEAVIAAVKAIAPTFGGINLEDIKSPDCFHIERRLQEELDIPVLHDDQHGTAIIACAGLLGALELTGRTWADLKVVFSGAGAAAIATADLLVALGLPRESIWMCDSEGLVYRGRPEHTFPEKMVYAQGDAPARLAEVIVGADVFIGLSVGGVLAPEMLRTMRPRPIVFAMANPTPEIMYDEAKAAVPDAIVATGRSDFPNQVNNVLGFPFLFRGALDCRARAINGAMKVAAVRALAELAHEDVPDQVLNAYGLTSLQFGLDYILPKPFDPRVLLWVAPAVARAAAESGVARQPIADLDAYREALERRIERSREVLRPLMNRVRLSPKRIVFPDGMNAKVIRAAQILVDEGICRPVLVGDAWRVHKRAEDAGVSLEGVEIVEIREDERFESAAQDLWELRRRRGLHLAAARTALRGPVEFAAMMVRRGEADGLLGGLEHAYAETIRPALQILGRAPGISHVSGAYLMIIRNRRLFFGDCTVNVRPDAETLAEIAVNTARLAASLGYTPRVALLSYSDFGEHRGDPEVDKVARAAERVRGRWPGLVIDGEMQADTAVNPDLQEDFPFSAVQGDANVLVFPDLASGNIAYKLLRDLAGATAVGPILLGAGRPVNVLSLGSTVDDIVNMAAITAHQATRLPSETP